MKVEVKKITDEKLLHEACAATIDGRGKPSLAKMYASEHSPIRTQLFWVQLEDVPLYVSTHLLRHHVGSQPFALTHRTDRSKRMSLEDRLEDLKCQLRHPYPNDNLDEIFADIDKIAEEHDRNTPTNLALFINAQSLMDMSHLRLCKMSSKGTQDTFKAIAEAIKEIDPDLHKHLVPNCVYRNGLCGEMGKCGYMNSESFYTSLMEYRKAFNKIKCI